MKFADNFHRILICGVEIFCFRCLLNLQLLIIVSVEGVKGIGVVYNNIEK